MNWSYTLSDRLLIAVALAPLAGVVGYGVIVAYDGAADSAQIQQTAEIAGLLNPDFVLMYADQQKAVFRTRRGLVTVRVGSTLDPFGQVLSIAMESGHWTVKTRDGATFIRDDATHRPE